MKSQRVINGRMVVGTTRRTGIEIDVYSGEVAEGEPIGQWDMPRQLGLSLAMEQGEIQTPRA